MKVCCDMKMPCFLAHDPRPRNAMALSLLLVVIAMVHRLSHRKAGVHYDVSQRRDRDYN